MNLDKKKQLHKSRNCLFCQWVNSIKLKNGEEYKNELEPRLLCETDNWFAILDKYPKVAGHTLVISKHPFDDFLDEIDDVNNGIKNELFQTAVIFSNKLKELFPRKRKEEGKIYLLTMCEHYEMWETPEGFTTEHLHFHLIPRHPGMKLRAEKLIYQDGKKWEMKNLEKLKSLIACAKTDQLTC